VDHNLFTELHDVAKNTNYIGEVKAAIINGYATIRAAQIIAAQQEKKKDERSPAA